MTRVDEIEHLAHECEAKGDEEVASALRELLQSLGLAAGDYLYSINWLNSSDTRMEQMLDWLTKAAGNSPREI